MMKKKVVYTFQARKSLRESLELLKKNHVSADKRNAIRKSILDKAEQLAPNPNMGEKEEYLLHLNQGHRRVVESHYKIIYLIEDDYIIITDIFDSRQDPSKMKA